METWTWVRMAGIGQLLLATGSLAIPRLLRWRKETARLSPLTRVVFWTYAAYILGSHLAFGLLESLAPGVLLQRAPLPAAVAGFIGFWWGARLALQAVMRRHAPPGRIFQVGEAFLVLAFVAFFSLHLWLCLHDLGVTP